MRIVILIFGLAGLISVYLFKMNLFYDPWENFIPSDLQPFPLIDQPWLYIIGKYIRFFLNDLFMFFIVYTLYPNKATVNSGLIILSFGGLVLLPLYLILSMNPSDSSIHFLHHLHRITMNPILMMLLIPALYLHRIRLL